ncbi:MAG TPA: GNAT family protein [Vicinamibacteria bacterium]
MICRVRPYRADDAQALHEAARESVRDMFPWLEWCHPDYSMAEAAEWASFQAARASDSPELVFAVVGPNDEFLGGCGVNQVNPIHRFANLGYWVRSSATGRGVARAAVRETAELVFQKTGLVRLEIVCAVENRRSQRVAEAVGAVREGILRNRLVLHGKAVDAVMYSLVRPR